MKTLFARIAMIAAMTFAGAAQAAPDLSKTEIMGFKFGMTRDQIMPHAKTVLNKAREGGYSGQVMQVCFDEKKPNAKFPCTNNQQMLFHFTEDGKMFAMYRKAEVDKSEGKVPYAGYFQQALDKYAPGKKFRPKSPVDVMAQNSFFLVQNPGQGIAFGDMGKPEVMVELKPEQALCAGAEVERGLSTYKNANVEKCGVVFEFTATPPAQEIMNPVSVDIVKMSAINYSILRESINAKANAQKAAAQKEATEMNSKPMKKHSF